MSVSDAAIEPAASDRASEAHALAFRIAFATAVGLTLGEVLGWDFPFIPSMLAVLLLTSGGKLNVKQAVAFVVVMLVACAFATLLAQILVDSPLVLLLTVALLVFIEFLLLARRQAMGAAAIFLIATAVVPLLAIESMSVAYGLIHSLVAGSALAVLLGFAAHAFFPSTARVEPGALRPPDEASPVPLALANAAVLMSVVIYFMLTSSPVSIVAVLTVIGILRQPASSGGGAGVGLIIGNLVGGLAATLAYYLVTRLPSPTFLLLVVFFVGLLFADRISRGGDAAPIYAAGLTTFLILLGLGLSPLPQDSGTLFIARVVDVMVAVLYAIGMANLLRWAFGAR
jgi:hypothetical protein